MAKTQPGTKRGKREVDASRNPLGEARTSLG